MPLVMILGGATLFLLGAIMLPFFTVAYELELNEKGSFVVPAAHQFVVEEPQVLALYDMTATRPEHPIPWNDHILRATLEMVHVASGATYPLVSSPHPDWGVDRSMGEFGFFEITRPGEYLLVVPEEVIPTIDRPIEFTMTLRTPIGQRAERVGYSYLVMALLGAFIFLWGIFRVIRPRQPSYG